MTSCFGVAPTSTSSSLILTRLSAAFPNLAAASAKSRIIRAAGLSSLIAALVFSSRSRPVLRAAGKRTHLAAQLRQLPGHFVEFALRWDAEQRRHRFAELSLGFSELDACVKQFSLGMQKLL